MISASSIVIAFSHSLQKESWSTEPNRTLGEGVRQWKSSLRTVSWVDCEQTDAESLTRVHADVMNAWKKTDNSRLFCVGNTPAQMEFFIKLKDIFSESQPVVLVALRGVTVAENDRLEIAGADFVVSHLCEVTQLVATAPFTQSLSVLLLAYNEAALIEKAVDDVHRFCKWYAPDYEILVIDDGSEDETARIAGQLASADNVRVISHAENMGMGASMRDGYEAASCRYVVSLPGDRQVKAHSLAAFLPHVSSQTVVVSQYPVPHSGRARGVMSEVFRLLLRRVGNLQVDVAGAYLFSTELYRRAPVPQQVASNTFLYSFQLLDSFRRSGASFYTVDIWPFPRAVGQSREARVGRILKMAGEIVKHRIKNKAFRMFHA